MCKAIEEMLKERRAKGYAEGFQEGLAEARMEGVLEILSDLVRDGLLSLQTAAARANMSQREFEEVMKKYGV